MPPMIMPPVMPSAAGQAVSQAGSRSRGDADDAQGRGFGAALERSRGNQRARPADDASGVAAAERKPVRKPGADDDTSDALPDPNLAFLAPPNTPLHALTLAGRTAQADVSASAAAADAAVGAARAAADKAVTAATDVVADPALQDALAGLKPDAAAADAKAAAAKPAPDTGLAAKDAAKTGVDVSALTPVADAAADATAPTTSLQDVVRAAVAAQTAGVAGGRPAGASASAGTSAAAGGRAAPRRTVSATTAEQLAAQAKPAEDTCDTVTAAAVPSASAAQPGTDATDTPAPAAQFALQQPAAATAQADRAGDTAGARAPVHTIQPEVGSDKWAPALGQQLARMSTSGHHTAELSLNPAGLGPLKVTLSMGDNQAQAMFVSAHESVRKAVEAALPQLRTSLSEQGITLGQASVGAETRQPFGNDAAFAQQQQQQNGGRQQAASYPGAGRAAASVQAAPVAAVRPGPAGNAGAGVDTFA
ncbi:Flagellar hook-length control protein [Variovorax paradoxus]|uniref:Flagellar hook-length control protein n=2 Tax=Variovorax paradoxus TaxID=34073 RepID=A0A679JRC1_VARPD|nr:Flagellar hook-length control protein [Variovorax paradoxus]